ncbi:MAG: hypothetical protein J4N95_01540 [Chloroflexi bacterium]|nr:hypothetical protein [Chloroflexota bacterium]
MVDESRFGSLDLGPKSLQNAAMVAGGLLMLLAIVTFTGLLSILPGYPAVILAFIFWGVLPGWWLQRALVASRRAGPVEQVVLAFVMSMALAAAPGLLALRFHWSLEAFAMAYALLAAAVSGISLLWPLQRHQGEDEADEDPHGATRGTTLLLILVAVPLLAIVTSPWWAGDRIARDADDMVYVGYISSYANSDELNASDPFGDTKQGTFRRMEVNVWVVMEALVAKTAGVKGFDLHMHYLPGILTMLAVASMFALAKGLFGSTRLALLAAILILIHAFLDLAPQEGVGRMLLLRMAQDKMAASFIFVPVGILLGAWYLEKPNLMAYIAVLLAAGAALVVHPLGLMSIAVALSSVAILRVFVERTRDSFQSAVYLVVPWMVLGMGFLGWSWLFGDRGEILYDYPRLTFNVTDVPGGMIIGSYHLLLNPLVLASIVLAVPAWLLARRQIGNQVLLGVVAGVLLIFFVPFVATPIAEATREEAVWRLHRLIPAALILAYVLHYGLMKLSSMGTLDAVGPWSSTISTAVLAPSVGVFLIFAAAFLIQEHYALADDGAFYDRTSDTTLLPWTGGSIFLGGVERAFSSDWRPVGTELALLDYLDEHAPPGSTVLIPRAISSRYFSGLLNDVRSVESPGAPLLANRRVFIETYYEGRLDEAKYELDVEAVLDDFSVDYIVVPPRTELNDDGRTFVRFDMDDFRTELGEPELVTFSVAAGDEFSAWAFDGRDEERISGVKLTVPTDMNPSRPTLDFLLEIAPAETLTEDAVVRLVVTYFPASGGERTSVVTDIAFEKGTPPGERVTIRRPITNATVEAGRSYRFIVSRLPNEPEDDLAGDVLFTGLRVKYWPTAFVPIGDTGFYIYKR